MRHKIQVFVAVLLTYAFQLTVFLPVRTELAYSYHHWLGDSSVLPSLTRGFALAVLGPRPGVANLDRHLRVQHAPALRVLGEQLRPRRRAHLPARPVRSLAAVLRCMNSAPAGR